MSVCRSLRTRCATLALVALGACSENSSAVGATPDASQSPERDAALEAAAVAETGSVDATSEGVPTDASPDTAQASCGLPRGGNFSEMGPYATRTLNASVGANKVVVTLPVDATDCPRAAIVFAHGFQLPTDGYQTLLSRIASWGYVLLSTDYPGSLLRIDHRDVEKALRDAKDALVAASIPGVPAVDATRILASGHSLGGKGATMAIISDSSFAGGFVFDPVDGNPGNPFGGGPSDAAPQLAPTSTATIRKPMGYVGATQSKCAAPPLFPGAPSSACAPAGFDAKSLYDGTTGTAARYLFTLGDFGHMQFLDNPACGIFCNACVPGNGDVPSRVGAAAALAIAFARYHLQGDLGALDWLSGGKKAELVRNGLLWDGTSPPPACP